MGGKLLPDLAWNNVLSLHLFVTVLPPGKNLSEALNFRQRSSVWFSCSCSKGFAQRPWKLCSYPVPPLGLPWVLWEWALRSAACGEGVGVWGAVWGPPANPY